MTWLTDLPSAVSATFSCDAAVYRYIHCVRLQEKGVGLIAAPLLKQMMIEGCKVSFSTSRIFIDHWCRIFQTQQRFVISNDLFDYNFLHIIVGLLQSHEHQARQGCRLSAWWLGRRTWQNCCPRSCTMQRSIRISSQFQVSFLLFMLGKVAVPI